MIKNFLKYLGLTETAVASPEVSASSETESVRHIIKSLDALDPNQAHYIALFASVLSRVANADLHISETEMRSIEEIIKSVGGLDETQAILVTEIAKNQNRLLGGVENYLITREFSKVSNDQQQRELLEALFAVAAAEEGISAEENQEIRKIAEEIGLTRKDFLAMRSKFKEELTVLKDIPRD